MLHCGEFWRFSPKEHFVLRLYIGNKMTYTLAYVPVPKLPECQLKAGLLLVDEKRGRRVALDRGLEVTGLLGVLAEAKARGLILRCQPVLEEMIRVAGFWIGEELKTRYLCGLGEL